MDPGKHKNWTRVGSYDSCLHGKYGVEIRIWSLNGYNIHSWVGISHGSNKFVMDSNNNDTEVLEDQLEEHALQLDAKDFACRSKAKAKPQRRESADSSSGIIPMNRRTWIDIQPGKHSLFAYEVSKKVIHLLRYSQQVHREEDGPVHCWRKRKIFRIHSHNLSIGLTIDGKHAWQQRRRSKKDIPVLH